MYSFIRIGARCKVDHKLLEKEADFMSSLQSWAPELRNLVGMKEDPTETCDVVIERPTFIMKVDASKELHLQLKDTNCDKTAKY